MLNRVYELRGREVGLGGSMSLNFAPNCFFTRNLSGHYGCVNAIEFSKKDEQLIASGGDDKRVLLWNLSDCLLANRTSEKIPSETQMTAEHESNIFCLQFDNDNAQLFSSGNDHQVIVHDVTTQRAKNVFLLDEACYSLSAHPHSSNIFAASTEDGRIAIFDTKAPDTEEPFVLASDRAPFHAALFNPEEPRYLASANAKEGIQLWDIRRAQWPVLRYGGVSAERGRQPAMSIRWDSSGKRLFAIRRKLSAVLFDAASTKAIATFDAPGYYNSCTMKTCSFAGLRDEYVVSGSDDFMLYIWRIPDQTAVDRTIRLSKAHLVLSGHRSIVNQVRFSHVNRCLISSGVEKVIKLWQFSNENDSTPAVSDPGGGLRPMYTHEEYIGMVLNSGERSGLPPSGFLDHTTEEDPRMMAFFDSLIQRDIDSSSSEDETSGLEDRNFFCSIIRPSRDFSAYSHEVVESGSSGSSEAEDEANADQEIWTTRTRNEPCSSSFFSSSRTFSHFSAAYARILDDGGSTSSSGSSPGRQAPSEGAEPGKAEDTESAQAAHEKPCCSTSSESLGGHTTVSAAFDLSQSSEISSSRGYLPNLKGAVRDITTLVIRKKKAERTVSCSNGSLVGGMERPASVRGSLRKRRQRSPDTGLSASEARRRIQLEQRRRSRRERVLNSVRERLTDLEDLGSETESERNVRILPPSEPELESSFGPSSTGERQNVESEMEDNRNSWMRFRRVRQSRSTRSDPGRRHYRPRPDND